MSTSCRGSRSPARSRATDRTRGASWANTAPRLEVSSWRIGNSVRCRPRARPSTCRPELRKARTERPTRVPGRRRHAGWLLMSGRIDGDRTSRTATGDGTGTSSWDEIDDFVPILRPSGYGVNLPPESPGPHPHEPFQATDPFRRALMRTVPDQGASDLVLLEQAGAEPRPFGDRVAPAHRDDERCNR